MSEKLIATFNCGMLEELTLSFFRAVPKLAGLRAFFFTDKRLLVVKLVDPNEAEFQNIDRKTREQLYIKLSNERALALREKDADYILQNNPANLSIDYTEIRKIWREGMALLPTIAVSKEGRTLKLMLIDRTVNVDESLKALKQVVPNKF
jgi:hypothetical protein